MATVTEHQDLTGSLTLNGDIFTCTSENGGAFLVKSGSTLDGYATFSGNMTTATSGNGGAIFNQGTVSLSSTLFENNSAAIGVSPYGRGGAIYNDTNATVTLTGTTFSGNEARLGGAIYNNAGTVNINGATFATATDTIYNAGTLNFSGNVDMSATTLTTKKCFDNKGTLTIGTIDQVFGGAIGDVYAIFNGDGATLNLNGGQISFDNRYGTGYGAIRNHYATSVANIGSVLIANNYSGTSGKRDGNNGGAVYNKGTMNFTGTTFSGNEAKRGGAIYNEGTVNINGATFATATDTIYNAGKLNFSGNVDMSATTLTTKKCFDNKGTLTIGTIDQVYGGASGDVYAIFNGDGATLNLNGGQISFDNRYGTGDGAIRNHYATSVANIGSVLLSNNYSGTSGKRDGNNGGAVYNKGTMNFTGTTFSGNEAKRGGAIYNEGTVNINGATFATATDTIYNAGKLNFSGNVDMSATTLTTKKCFDNKGTLTIGTIDQVYGGAMGDVYAIFNGDGATLNLNGGQISFDNRYGAGYGAIRNHYATSVANIGSVLLSNNYSGTSGKRDGNNGGAAYNKGTMNFTGTTFSGNEAKRGGAIYNEGTVNINGATFATATDTIFNYGTINFVDGTVDASATAITSHSRISNDGSILVVGEFNSSGATTFGGGGGFYNGSVTTVNGGTFGNNHASLGGGAIYNKAGATLTLNNMLFADNKAPAGAYGGGAIYADEGGSLTVSGSTFSGNGIVGDGGAIYNYGDLEISNTLFYANTATGNGGALLGFSSGNTIDISGSTFATASDTIHTNGTINFADRNIINASISGSGIFNVNNAELIFNNSETITVAALNFSGTGNSISVNGSEVAFSGFEFTAGSQVNFNSLDLSGVMLTVDATDGEAKLASGVSNIGNYVINDNDYHLYLDGSELFLKENKAGVLESDSTGSVYGGGNGSTNDGTGISQTIASGFKQGTVFAGSQNGVDSVITTTVTGGSIKKNLYGGGKVSAHTTNLTIDGGSVDMVVYGGIYVTSALGKAGNLNNANLTINDGTFNHYISGGSRVDAFDTTTTHTTGTINLVLNGGEFTVAGSESDPGTTIYGAGYLKGTGAATENVQYQVTTCNVTINGANIVGAVYGGAFSYNKGLAQVDEANITVESGSIDRVFGGGWAQGNGISNVGDVNITVSGNATVGIVYAGGVNASGGKSEVTGTIDITISDSAAVDTVFMGGRYNNSLVSGDVTVTISGDAKNFDRISGNGSFLENTGVSSLIVDTIVNVAALDGIDKLTIIDGSQLNLTDADFAGLTEICFDLGDGVLDTADWTALTGVSLDNFNGVKFMVDDTEMILADGVYSGSGFKVYEEDNSIKFAKLA